MASEYQREMEERWDMIEKLWSSNIAAYEQQLEHGKNWYKSTTNIVEPAPTNQPLELAPLTAQEIYTLAKQGGEQWQAVLNQVKQQWT